jgi:hypothetical protein
MSKLSSTERFKRQRRKMFEKHPFCYWCGCQLQLIERSGGKCPANAATIDHIYSRLHPNRTTICHNETRRVLACYKCNNNRSREETKLTYLDRQRENSGNRPLEAYPYLERKWRLQKLREKVEAGTQGLVRVMGLPIREMIERKNKSA